MTRPGSLLLLLALATATGLGSQGSVWAHGSEYVYARLIPGPAPRLEVCLEYNDNPIVDSREQARHILGEDLLLRGGADGGRESNLSGFASDSLTWSETTFFPASAPVPVPEPGLAEGLDHRLLTATVALPEQFRGPFRLSVKPGSEQAVIYWIDEPRAADQPPRWQILLAGDTSEAVVLASVLPSGPICAGIFLGGLLLLALFRARRR